MKFRALVFALLLAPFAHADPTLGTPCVSSTLELGGTTASVSCSIPADGGGGADRGLACAVTYEDGAGTIGDSAVVIDSGGGITMTPSAAATTEGANHVRWFHALEASLPSSGTYNVTATASGYSGSAGAIGLSCYPFSNDFAQKAPTVTATTATSVSSISDSVIGDNGDYLLKATSAGTGNETHTHGLDSWTETLDETLNDDSSQSSAYFSPASFATFTVNTTLSSSTNRLVQSVVRIESEADQGGGGGGGSSDNVYAMTTCPGTTKLYRDEDCGDGDCCPPVLTNCSATATGSTTAEGRCDTDTNSGTAYLCLNENSSAPATFVADPSVSTGCDFHGSATPSSNAFTRAATGLTSSTTYYPHFGHKYAQRAATTTSGTVPTPTTGGSGTGIASAGHWIGINCKRGLNGPYGCDDMNSTMLNSSAVGFLLLYQWRSLHSGIGSYTFDKVNLAATAARNAGKQYVIQLDATSFGSGGYELPGFMANNTIYGGLDCPGKCGSVLYTPTNTTYPRWWDSDVEAAFKDLVDGINAEFSSDDNFVGFVLTESTQGNQDGDRYNCPDFNDAIISRAAYAASVIGDHRVWQNVNFTCGGGGETRTREDIADTLMTTYNVQWGTPDLLVGNRLPQVEGIFNYVRDDASFNTANARVMPQLQPPWFDSPGEVTFDPYQHYYSACIDGGDSGDEDGIAEPGESGTLDPDIIVWWELYQSGSGTYESNIYDIINNPGTYPLPCT